MAGTYLSSRQYVLTYVVLMALLLTNVLIGFLNLGWVNMFIAVTIATLQAGIIALILMHGLFEKVLVRLVIAGAIIWLLIMMTLTVTDYITRNWLPISGK